MFSRAVRVGQNWTDDSNRRNSSTPGTISSGRRRSFSSYWLRVFRLIGLACKVLGLLILVLSPEPIYGPFSLGAKMTKSEQWQRIPTELSLEQFRQFV